SDAAMTNLEAILSNNNKFLADEVEWWANQCDRITDKYVESRNTNPVQYMKRYEWNIDLIEEKLKPETESDCRRIANYLCPPGPDFSGYTDLVCTLLVRLHAKNQAK